MQNAYKILFRKPEGKGQLKRPRCRWEDNIEIELGEIHVTMWTWFIWLRVGTIDGLLRRSGCIKGVEFLDHLSDCRLFRKGSAPWS
jgi:hypothetical protein